MACVNCNKIRTAILHGKMAEAAGLTVEALREKFRIGGAEDQPEAEAAPVEVAKEEAPAKSAKASTKAD